MGLLVAPLRMRAVGWLLAPSASVSGVTAGAFQSFVSSAMRGRYSRALLAGKGAENTEGSRDYASDEGRSPLRIRAAGWAPAASAPVSRVTSGAVQSFVSSAMRGP